VRRRGRCDGERIGEREGVAVGCDGIGCGGVEDEGGGGGARRRKRGRKKRSKEGKERRATRTGPACTASPPMPARLVVEEGRGRKRRGEAVVPNERRGRGEE
jgi:hypothetical protein